MKKSKIIELARKGDCHAFGVLVEKYQGRIYSLALRLAGNEAEAADITQETFLRAWKSIRTFDTSRPFGTWLYAICLNLSRNRFRSRWRLVPLEPNHIELMSLSEAPSASLQYQQNQLQNYLLEGLRQLPYSLAEVLVLRYFQDLKFAEIAEILDTSVSSAKMRTYRGLEKMRQIMIEKNIEL